MPEFDYKDNPYASMIEMIKAHVKKHHSIITASDDPMKREVGFRGKDERWAINLSQLKASFSPELDPEGRLTNYRDRMMSTHGRDMVALMLTNGTAP